MRLCILGGGPGGYTAAVRAALLGFEVTLVEQDKNLGGTCLNRGCIPTKALVETACRFQEAKNGADFGLLIEPPQLNLEAVQARKNSVVRRLAMGVDSLMKRRGVKVINARGRLLKDNELEAGEERITFDRLILATGSSVAVPKVFPVDGERILTSDHILNLTKIPESLIVVGSGAVGMEFASIFSSLGTRVSVVELADRLLPAEDKEISAEIKRLYSKAGLKIFTGVNIEKCEPNEGGVRIFGQGLPEVDGQFMLEGQYLLAAVGRRPNVLGIGLEEAGVELDCSGFVKIDNFMRTSVPYIYAVGDIVPAPKLAHMAAAEAILAVEHMAGLDVQPLNYNFCPSATYCRPEVASVGLTQEQAEAQGYKLAIGKFPMAALGKANISGHTEGFVKIIACAEKHKVLGVHIIGEHACDLIAEGVLALQQGACLEDIATAVHPHPSLSEAVAEAAHHALGAPINFIPAPARRGRRL
ncbi:MAG: dihydrolipoyl dehydrogenase [Candidatus Bruticola sp.]